MTEITKVKLIAKSSIFNFNEYQVFFRIYDNDKTNYYSGSFIINYDSNDLDNYYYNEDTKQYKQITQKDIKNFRNDLIDSFINSYDPTYESHKDFIKACNITIDKHNKKINN